jgi:hypothetical protein
MLPTEAGGLAVWAAALATLRQPTDAHNKLFWNHRIVWTLCGWNPFRPCTQGFARKARQAVLKARLTFNPTIEY